MNKEMIMKIVGVIAIVGGSASLYMAGVSETVVGGIVAGVFVLAGVIASLFKPKE